MLTRDQLRRLRRERPLGRNRVKRAMALAAVTQVQLAQATGFTQPYISRICNDAYESLPLETAAAFARYFGCPIEDLFPAQETTAGAA